MRPLSILALVLLVGCGGGAPPASLSLDQLDELAADIEAGVSEVDEAFCDPSDGDPMALCYAGMATASLTEARTVVCDQVVPIVEERTSGSVQYIAFDSRDDQTIGFIDC